MSTSRRENEEALAKITTDDLDPGGTMPRQVFDQFYVEVQESAELLDEVRTVEVDVDQNRIPKLSVSERQRRGQNEGEGPSEYGSVSTDFVDIDTQKGSVYWDLTKETLNENVEGENLADRLLSLMSQQFAVDTQELGIIGDESSGTAFLAQNNGWLTFAESNGMPAYDHQADDGSGTMVDQPINTELFNQMLLTMDDRYLERTDPVFLVSRKQLQSYRNSLTGTESDAAYMALMGSNDLTPFEYDIVAPSMWPDDRAMFIDPNLLVYALQRDVDVSVVEGTDKTHEEDLVARYAIHAKDDFVIEETDAGVLATGLQPPMSG